MAVRRRAVNGSEAVDSFEHRAYAWLSSDEAERWAKKLLAQYRLRIEPHEITSDAMEKILLAVRAKPERFDDETWVKGRADHYCITVMRRMMVDILRGRKRAPLALLDDVDGEHFDPTDDVISDIDVMLHDGRPTDSGPGGGDLLDRLRVGLESSGAKPWVVSAALSWFTLAAFPQTDTGKSPVPEAGAHPAHARLWPSLWFAGERDLFESGGGRSSAALRKKRSRRMREVDDAMTETRARIELWTDDE